MFTPIYNFRRHLKALICASFVVFLFIVGKNSGKRKVHVVLNSIDSLHKSMMMNSFESSQLDKKFELHKLNFTTSTVVSTCNQDQPPFLLCIVHSSPSHFLYRSTIRRTWGSVKKLSGRTLRIVFLVGTTKRRLQSKLSYEMKTHADIVQGNFVDSYRNLTLKHLLGYKWVSENCPNAVFVLKADDDVFIDIFRTKKLLLNTFGSKPANLLACMIIPAGGVPGTSGKWAITKEEFQHDVYPEYCSGMSYFMTTDIVSKLLEQSQYQPFFWIDDIFMTGLVAEMSGVKRTDLSVWFARNEYPFLRWMASNSTRPCPWLVAELSPRNWPENVLKLWSKTVRAWNLNNGTL